LSDWALAPLKVMVLFSKDWRGGQFEKHLGITLPTEAEDKDRKRTHVDVQARSRSCTVHEKVPVEYLDPVRPAGVGDVVTIVGGPGVGGVYRVQGMQGEMFDLADVDDASIPPFPMFKTDLAVVFTR
jgi:hypothetical protein